MRALLFGTVAEGQGYPRVRGLVAALESLGIEVARLTRPIDRHAQGKARRSRTGLLAGAIRLLRARRRLLAAARAEPRPDLVLVGYPAQAAADLPGRIWPGVPVLIDFFLSAYDTAVSDRRLFAEHSLAASLLRWIDRRAASRGSLVLVDTPQMAAFTAALTGISPERFRVVPCGDPDAPGETPGYRPPKPGESFRLLHVGSGVPLHGLEYVLDAVHRTEAVELILVGGGEQAQALLAARPCPRVRHQRSWVDRAGLGALHRESHLALGVFGASSKAGRVVPLKVFHALAEGCPILTGEAEAVGTLLAPGSELLTCPRASGPALATALEQARRTPARLAAIARAGARAFRERFSTEALGRRFAEILVDLGLGSGMTLPRKRPRELVSSSGEASGGVR